MNIITNKKEIYKPEKLKINIYPFETIDPFENYEGALIYYTDDVKTELCKCDDVELLLEARTFIGYYIMNNIQVFDDFYEDILAFFKSLHHFINVPSKFDSKSKNKKMFKVAFYDENKEYCYNTCMVNNIAYFKNQQLKDYWTFKIRCSNGLTFWV